MHGHHLYNKVLSNASYFYYQQKQKVVCFTMLIILFQLNFFHAAKFSTSFVEKMLIFFFIRKLVKS